MDGANDYAFWYEPVYEVTRGEIVESVHFGALAVVDADGRLIASRGSAEAFAYLRSTAKPFQALPLIEAGGVERFGFTQAEIALMCASHSGTDEHADVAASIQSKVDVGELDLMCGVHPPMHEPTAAKLRDAGQQPTPNRHNCSGKHSGMLALAQLNGWPVQHYIDPIHPVQQQILQTLAEMCDYPMEEVELGIDGCSVPNFALPLRAAAHGFARLCDPRGLPEKRGGLPHGRGGDEQPPRDGRWTGPVRHGLDAGGGGPVDRQGRGGGISGRRAVARGFGRGFSGARHHHQDRRWRCTGPGAGRVGPGRAAEAGSAGRGHAGGTGRLRPGEDALQLAQVDGRAGQAGWRAALPPIPESTAIAQDEPGARSAPAAVGFLW